MTIYEIYVRNKFRFGFFVRRDTWKLGRHAKVVKIEYVKEADNVKINPSYFVTLEAEWLIGGTVEIDSGDNFCWEQVYPPGNNS